MLKLFQEERYHVRFSRNNIHENWKTNWEQSHSDWEFHSDSEWLEQCVIFTLVCSCLTLNNWKSHILESKSPKNHPKRLKNFKAFVAKKKPIKSEQLFDWLLTVKKSDYFSYWNPGTDYFPNEILNNRSLWEVETSNLWY